MPPGLAGQARLHVLNTMISLAATQQVFHAFRPAASINNMREPMHKVQLNTRCGGFDQVCAAGALLAILHREGLLRGHSGGTQSSANSDQVSMGHCLHVSLQRLVRHDKARCGAACYRPVAASHHHIGCTQGFLHDGDDAHMEESWDAEDSGKDAFALAVESLSEVSLAGFLTVDPASLRALQIFQACSASALLPLPRSTLHAIYTPVCRPAACWRQGGWMRHTSQFLRYVQAVGCHILH